MLEDKFDPEVGSKIVFLQRVLYFFGLVAILTAGLCFLFVIFVRVIFENLFGIEIEFLIGIPKQLGLGGFGLWLCLACIHMFLGFIRYFTYKCPRCKHSISKTMQNCDYPTEMNPLAEGEKYGDYADCEKCDIRWWFAGPVSSMFDH